MSAQSRVTGDEFLRLIRETIPASAGAAMTVEEIAHGRAVVRLKADPSQIRAGGTLSGPTIMTLADTALYAAVLSAIGLEALAVTTDLAFHFLRRPALRDLVADARLLRCGRRLAVGDVVIRSDGSDDAVAHAVGTYALPEAQGAK
jgi:uncharacterized protein (TIGR00369 family)